MGDILGLVVDQGWEMNGFKCVSYYLGPNWEEMHFISCIWILTAVKWRVPVPVCKTYYSESSYLC